MIKMTQTTSKSKSFGREVTRPEQRFLAAPTSHISLVLRVRGDITKEALRDAVDRMLVTYPQFGVRIKKTQDAILSTTEGAAEVPVKVYERKDEAAWLNALNKEHSIPVYYSKGPLTRFILLKGDEISELILFCHHTICDGRSLELGLREVILNLGDPSRTPPIMPEVPAHTPEIFPEHVSGSRIKSWLMGQVNKKWERERAIFDEEDIANLWEAFWKGSRYRVELVELGEDETERFVQACRNNGVTVNSALIVTFVKARAEELKPYEGKVKVITAVDTRERLQVDVHDAVGLYAGGVKHDFDYRDNNPFWDNVRNLHNVIGKHLRDNDVFGPIYDQFLLDQTLIDAMLFAEIGDLVEPHQSRYDKISTFVRNPGGLVSKYLKKTVGAAPHIVMTNLGRMGIPEEVEGIKIDCAFFTPSSGLKMELALGVATAGGRLTAAINYHDAYFDHSNMTRISRRARELIGELTQ